MGASNLQGSIRVLGPLRVSRGSDQVALRPAQRRLLAILLLDPVAELDREALVDRMWGDDVPPTAASALQVHLSALRRAVPGVVVTVGSGYRVDLDGYSLDRIAFQELASRARTSAAAGLWDRALKSASGAIGAWRGSPYPELRDDEYAAAPIARLSATHEELADVLVRARLALGQTGAAIAELRELVQRHPLREPLWEELMRALYATGRRAEALAAFQALRRILADELGIEPASRLQTLEERIVREDEALSPPVPVEALSPSVTVETPGNLPIRPTSFVGREADVAELARILRAHRLVTVVGGPGLGKTRLAIEAAHTIRNERPDGAWFVGLATARTTEEVIAAVGGALGLRRHAMSLAVLADRVRMRAALIILDNCEHLAGPCREFLDLVLSRPGPVRILATSRRALGVEGEESWTIGPLQTPDVGVATAAELVRSPAVRLFLDRARAVDRAYRVTDASAPHIAALCRRTDGVPLALELAAAWTPALGPQEIEEMLRGAESPSVVRRLEIGTDHHRSLHTAIGWSIALLAPGDRQLFEATSVFRVSFTLDDAVSVCARVGERRRTAAAIGRLVDASLLVADRSDDGSMSYRALAPLRELARDRLELTPEWPGIRFRFVTHYLGKARAGSGDPFQAVTDLDGVDRDIDNLREAFELALADGRADEVARAIVTLDGYFMNRYLSQEQRTWLARVLPAVTDPCARAHALLSDAVAAQATNALDESLRRLEEALAAFRALGDDMGAARALLALAGLHSNRGSWNEGAEAARAGRRLAADMESPSSLGIACYYLGTNLAYSGHVEEGVAALAESAEHFRCSAEHGRVSQALSTIAYLAMLAGDEDRAGVAAREAVVAAQRSGSQVRLVRALSAAAAVDARWGDTAAARRGLAEAHDRLRAQANEDLFEFLLPAGVLLAREGAWELCVSLVAAVEAAIAESGQGYPVPWRTATSAWLEEAAAARHSSGQDVPGDADVAAVRAEVRRFLGGGAA